MEALVATMSKKGQITVPAEIRRALHLKVGDRVSLTLDDEGRLQATLRPVRSVVDSTFGMFTPRKRPEDFKELRRMFEEEWPREGSRSEDEPSQ